MHALWKARSATAREIYAALERETGWAYTTLRTLLARLEEKRAVACDRSAPAHVYRALAGRAASQKRALAALVVRAFEGAAGPVLAHLVDLGPRRLSRAERAELEKLVAPFGGQRSREPRRG
jgi:predicted transcriptional regulator